MADIRGLIDGLGHGPQDRGRQHRIVRPLAKGPQYLIQLARTRTRLGADLEAENLQHQAQALEFFLVRAGMHAIQRGQVVTPQELRGLHVGRDHAFLDQTVCIIARSQADFLDAPVAAQFDFRLRQLQVQGATLGTGLPETPENSIQVLDLRQYTAEPVAGIGIAIAGRLHVLVDQALARAHHRAIERRFAHLACAASPACRNHAQPVDIRLQ